MTIKCVPIKEIYFDSVSGFRVLACEPLENNMDVKMNKYGNFTVSGSNINFKLKVPILLELQEKEGSKYEGEYSCVGYGGVEIADEIITIPQEQEESILRQFMTKGQANNVLKAYPNFVELILNGKAEEIKVDKIHNVGDFRFSEYVKKIEDNCDLIFFNKECWKLGINKEADIDRIRKGFKKAEQFVESFNKNPYGTMCDELWFGFEKIDYIVLNNFPELKDSKIRCKYFCIDMLKMVELSGDTKVNPNVISRYIKEYLPELFPHVVDVIKNDERFYYDNKTKFCSLRHTWKQEVNIAEHIKHRLSLNENNVNCDKNFVEKFILANDMNLTEEQIKILRIMDNGWIGVLTGPAGSGKSFSTKALIRMLEEKNKSYTLLAPTGVASKVLRQMTGRKTSTIHMLLACQGLVGEYVIIDEFSMVSVSLLSALFDYIGKNRKIVFVCDENQLPSIGAGNVIHDIISANVVPTAKLTKVFRYKSSGIVTNVTDVRNGRFNNAEKEYSDFNFIQTKSDTIEQILKQYQHYLDMGYKKEDILILSPFRVTDSGSHAINNIIQKKYNNHPETEAKIKVDGFDIYFKIGDRVINTKNNYHMPKWDIESGGYEFYEDEKGEIFYEEMPIYNGDLGNVVDVRNDEEGKIQVVVEWSEGIGCVEGPKIHDLLLGYCISIHKSQSAQAKCVIVVINKKGRDDFINRNILYTGLSRAQEQLSVIANQDIIENALKLQANLTRETWLEELLKSIN